MENNVIEQLAQSDNPIIAVLAFLVLAMFSVIVFQWRHTANSTVPLFIWKGLVVKIEDLLKISESTATIIDERLKR